MRVSTTINLWDSLFPCTKIIYKTVFIDLGDE